jgi:hypothetical protein
METVLYLQMLFDAPGRMNHFNIQRNKKATFWLLQVSGWGIYGLVYYFVYYFGRITAFSDFLAIGITFITGFMVSLGLRFFYHEIDYKNRLMTSLSFIVIFSSIVGANLWYCLDIFLSIPLWGYSDFLVWLAKFQPKMYVRAVFFNTIILITWSALYFVINFWIEWKIQTEQTEKANLLAQSAQLQMLRYQLNPHFLFNALNSIRALIEENKQLARSMVTELAEFLRYALLSKNYSDIPLSHEVEAIRHYFAIEKKRFESKLKVKIDIEPPAEQFPVLSFLIHPVVENAVKYGMRTSAMPLEISLSATVTGDRLRVEVRNSGHWVEQDRNETEEQGTGTGLRNVQQRLENAFPENHAFRIIKNQEYVSVVIELWGKT